MKFDRTESFEALSNTRLNLTIFTKRNYHLFVDNRLYKFMWSQIPECPHNHGLSQAK